MVVEIIKMNSWKIVFVTFNNLWNVKTMDYLDTVSLSVPSLRHTQ